MFRNYLVGGWLSVLMVSVSVAQAQRPNNAPACTTLPLKGAPVAQVGPYEVESEPAFDSPGHVVFRPAKLDAFPQKDTLPVVVWANGGCVADSAPYAPFLTTIASYGFLVLATTPVEGADQPFPKGDSAPTGYDRFAAPFRAALDWAETENVREGSPLRGKVATDRMAAMGHSCGGGLAVMLGADPRIDTVGVISSAAWGSVHLDDDPRNVHIGRLHGPVLLINGHESDVAMADSVESFEAINRVPVFYGARRNAGHCSTFGHPGGGEFANVAASWLSWTLKRDAHAGAMFVGERCGLCMNPHWEVRSKGLE